MIPTTTSRSLSQQLAHHLVSDCALELQHIGPGERSGGNTGTLDDDGRVEEVLVFVLVSIAIFGMVELLYS